MDNFRRKQDLMREARTLYNRYMELHSFVTLQGCLSKPEQFDKLRMLMENGYKLSIEKYQRMFGWNEFEDYIQNLPRKLDRLRELKDDVSEFMQRVKHRSPHFFKTGNFSMQISEIIDVNDVRRMIHLTDSCIKRVAIKPLFYQANPEGKSITIQSDIDNPEVEEIVDTLDREERRMTLVEREFFRR